MGERPEAFNRAEPSGNGNGRVFGEARERLLSLARETRA